ncbi:MAG: protease HtpX [Gammaproteobacteria bacterium]|nr:protease HtpX [Gammaproteobacteria bacterium]
MMRILLFLATNIAVLIVINIVVHLLGLTGYLSTQGINYQALLMMAAVYGMVGSFISLAMSKTMAKMSMGVQIIDQPQNQTEKWLYDVVEKQAQKVGIGMPEVGIFNAGMPNAFATGMSKNSSLVAVSTGLLQSMTPDEVEAVLGHEMSHVANGDMVTMTLLQGVMNTFVYFFATIIGYVVDRATSDNERGIGMGYYMTQMLAQMVLGFLAAIIVAWFSRYREFKADAGGANLAGKQKMINALKALQRGHEAEELPGQFAAFGINGGGIQRLFMTHPPLAERIAALQNAQ